MDGIKNSKGYKIFKIQVICQAVRYLNGNGENINID
jgi:hypothetical protein